MTTIVRLSEPATFLPQHETPCLRKLTASRPWARTLAVRVGESHVGVRVTTETTARLVEERFAALRRPELDGSAPPHFSVHLADETRRGWCRCLSVAYRDHTPVARRRSADELLDDLADLLNAVELGSESAVVAVAATAVLDPQGSAVLLPHRWRAELLPQQHRLADHGIEVLASDVHALDPSGSGLRPPASMVGRRDVVPVAGWGVRVLVDTEVAFGQGAGVQAAVNSVVNLPSVGPGRALRTLARMAEHTAFHPLTVRSEFDMTATALELARRT